MQFDNSRGVIVLAVHVVWYSSLYKATAERGYRQRWQEKCWSDSLTLSIQLYPMEHRTTISIWHDGTLQHTRMKIFTLEKKRLLFENGINQILMTQLKLYPVVCYFIVTYMLLPNFKALLIFLCFFLTSKNPLVWCSCQMKHLASNSKWVKKQQIDMIMSKLLVPATEKISKMEYCFCFQVLLRAQQSRGLYSAIWDHGFFIWVTTCF